MINARIIAGICVAAFVLGCLLTTVVAWMFVRRHRQIASGSRPGSLVAPTPAVANISEALARTHCCPCWRPQPEGFDQREHHMIIKLDSGHVINRTLMLQTLIRNLVSTVKWREPVSVITSSLIISTSRDRFGDLPSNTIDWALLSQLFANRHSQKAGLTCLLSHLIFHNIALASNESGPPSWNLLSPHLAGLFQEIEHSRKGAELIQQEWNLWTLEKCRIYACESLYPDIYPTEVLFNEEKQPTTNADALLKMLKFVDDLLEPYIIIDDVFRETFRTVLIIAGQLGVCIHKSLRPWCWNFAAPANRILLFPAICEAGDESGIRSMVPTVILPAQIDRICDVHGNLIE